jgi:hypothetical protein
VPGGDRRKVAAVAACDTPLTDGMAISTHTPVLENERRMILKMLAQAHPAAAHEGSFTKPFYQQALRMATAFLGRRNLVDSHTSPANLPETWSEQYRSSRLGAGYESGKLSHAEVCAGGDWDKQRRLLRPGLPHADSRSDEADVRHRRRQTPTTTLKKRNRSGLRC